MVAPARIRTLTHRQYYETDIIDAYMYQVRGRLRFAWTHFELR